MGFIKILFLSFQPVKYVMKHLKKEHKLNYKVFCAAIDMFQKSVPKQTK